MDKSPVDSIIAERYKIIDTLGTGAMGSVYKVLDQKTEQTVALKLLRETSSASKMVDGLKSEFEILKNLHHPHVAKIFDFGVTVAESGEKQYYFTEELITGTDLWNASKTMSFEAIEDLFVQALRALEFLHTNKIYHLDLKPSNLLIIPGKEPKLKVIDFGLSGFKDTEIMLGTPSYTAPEIILSLPRGAQADLYSLGVIFYKCFTRTNPFQSGDVKETWNRHIHLKVDPPSKINAKIPEYIDIILMNLMEKKASDRYSRAAYVIRSLNYLSGKNYPLETEETFVSYLPEEGKLIGRDDAWQEFKEIFKEQFSGKKVSLKVVVILGAVGTGKTRFVKEMKHFAQLCEVPAVDWEEKRVPGTPFLWIGDLPSPISEEEKDRIKERLSRISGGIAAFSATSAGDINWFRGWVPNCAVLELGNFNVEEVHRYILSATGLKSMPQSFVGQLYQRSEGNPKLLKEMLQKLMESGELLLLEGHLDEKALENFSVSWEMVENIPVLKEIFRGRWEKLDNAQKELLIFLSILGHSAMLEELDIIALEVLVKIGWVSKGFDGAYSITNPCFTNLIIGLLSTDIRSRWHNKVAQFIENKGGEPWEVDYHKSFGSDSETALSAIPEYAKGCVERERWELAKPALDRAWDLGVKEEWWGELMLKWILAVAESGKNPDIEKAMERLQDFPMPNSHAWQAEICLARTTLALKEKDYHQATLSLQKVLKESDKELPRTIWLRAKNIEGKIFMDQGKLEYAEQIFCKNFKEWLVLSDDEKIKIINNDLASCYFLQQEYQKCWDQLRVELPYYLKLNNTVLLSSCYYLLGCTALKLGKTVDGISFLKKCLASAKEIQKTDLLLLTYNELGNLYFNQKQLDEARIHFEHALNLAQRKKNHSRMALIAANLGVVHAELGQDPQCFSFLQLATRLLGGMTEMRVENWVAKGLTLLELSRYYRRHGRDEEARVAVEEARAIAKDEAALRVILPQIEAQYEKTLHPGDGASKDEISQKKEGSMQADSGHVTDEAGLERMNKLTSHILESLEKVEALMGNLVDRLNSLEEHYAQKSSKHKHPHKKHKIKR